MISIKQQNLLYKNILNKKRLELAVALIKEDKSKSNVAILSRFKDYRSLHRTYMGNKSKDASLNEQQFLIPPIT